LADLSRGREKKKKKKKIKRRKKGFFLGFIALF